MREKTREGRAHKRRNTTKNATSRRGTPFHAFGRAPTLLNTRMHARAPQ